MSSYMPLPTPRVCIHSIPMYVWGVDIIFCPYLFAFPTLLHRLYFDCSGLSCQHCAPKLFVLSLFLMLLVLLDNASFFLWLLLYIALEIPLYMYRCFDKDNNVFDGISGVRKEKNDRVGPANTADGRHCDGTVPECICMYVLIIILTLKNQKKMYIGEYMSLFRASD